jgi:PhnB protein
MPLTTYLFFNGQCAEAMAFYEKALHGKVVLMTYGESPDGAPPNVDATKVMHARLELPDGGVLMASDDAYSSNYEGMKGFSVTLVCSDADEVRRVYDLFSEGGKVQMPLQKTFWTEAFAGVTDRFGTPWMLFSATIA